MITFYFHVRKSCRIKYGLEDNLFTVTGDLIIANFFQARLLAEKINRTRIEEGKSDQQTAPGMINGLGIMHEIFHYLIRYYEEKENPGVFKRKLEHLKKKLGERDLDILLLEYLDQFPVTDILKGKITASEFLEKSTSGKSNREILLEELLLLHLENVNPAVQLLEELFSDKDLAAKTRYLKYLSEMEQFFVSEKPFGPANLPLVHFLKIPIKSNPLSIEAQLDYIRENWGVYVYALFNERLLSGKDLLAEDARLYIKHFGFSKGTPPVPSYEFDRDYFDWLRKRLLAGEHLSDAEMQYYHSETERFTADIDWMPRVVMIAKNAYVWLYQLSRQYGYDINRLDQIPDEELDQLAHRNFTALWLIGIWERSSASKKIKQYMGNPEAAASAYSLFDYVIATELGGEESFQNLKDRAWRRGIRMASDMVPNHTGIFSKWIIEKPDYFIQSDFPPYPGYTFNSSNLSDDGRVEVRIEDKYYNHTDAAVVFQRKDAHTGSVRYIYHGNDGTHMPWNDTAQLDLLNPEVRESLIQTIMHVARKTPIIRFDAAMTLTKKHYQRLWFPIPGTGSGIPSRSDYAMTRSRFDEVMPEEFWREVVDRLNSEMPETLLLAEAFWLMESYFVRTLGMHRVYNSAFMHMMMKEENEKYRLLIKNTLGFNPEVLKRYVNFMSNPDEETAVNQFGKGDKYFGVAVLMVTLPGLPMFGHGQTEGFAEKYGMEYKRSYYDEYVDEYLVHRHNLEIFPLMAKRYLFSQVNYFEFYDFIGEDGKVVENVLAYTNRAGNERALIIYNNSYTETKGSLKSSLYKAQATPDIKIQSRLGDALGINPGWKVYYIYKDYRDNLEYLTSGYDLMENGMHLYLAGYQYYAFLDFREVYDSIGDYERLRNHLSGRGVPSVQYAMEEFKLTPFHSTIRHLLSKTVTEEFREFISGERKNFPVELISVLKSSLDSINHYETIHFDTGEIFSAILSHSEKVKQISKYIKEEGKKGNLAGWKKHTGRIKIESDLILPFLLLLNIKKASGETDLFIKTRMEIPLYDLIYEEPLRNQIPLLNVFTSEAFSNDGIHTNKKEDELKLLNRIFSSSYVCGYLNVNTWEGKTYYSKENFEALMSWFFTANLLYQTAGEEKKSRKTTSGKAEVRQGDINRKISSALKKYSAVIDKILKASDSTGYQKDLLIKELKSQAKKPAKKTVQKISSDAIDKPKKSTRRRKSK